MLPLAVVAPGLAALSGSAKLWLGVGAGTYLLNLGVGVLAQVRGMRFGVWHHVLYAVVFATAIGAAVFAFHPGLLVTLGALALFPRAKPRTAGHPALAIVGLGGYLTTLFPVG